MLVLIGLFGVLVEPTLDGFRNGGAVLIPGVAEAVRCLNQAGYRVAALIDRSGASGAPLDPAMLDRMRGQVRDALRQGGASLDDILAGDHPAPAEARGGGAVRDAIRYYRTGPDGTALITDSLSNLRQAAALGCRRILVRTGRGARTQAEGLPREVLPVQVHEDLPAAVEALLGNGG